MRSIWALAPVLAMWLLAGCAGGSGGERADAQEESAGPVTGEFVGDISEADAFVSLLAEEPQEQGSEEREVRAYLCDGRQLNEWFTGTVTANEVQLASPNGVQLDATLASEVATGTITLSDGTSFAFMANPATGIAGLFDVTVSEDGQTNGTSERGGRLEGQLGDGPQDGRYPLTGTITSLDGEETRDFEATARAQVPVEGRFIVLDDGQIRGGKKRTSTGVVDITTDL